MKAPAKTKKAATSAASTGKRVGSEAVVAKAAEGNKGAKSGTSKTAPKADAKSVAKRSTRIDAADATASPSPSPSPSPPPSLRIKLVRDSFTMPREDFELIATLKARALDFRRPTKKSELLRAGLQQLAALSEAQLRDALAALRPVKTGRPKKKR